MKEFALGEKVDVMKLPEAQARSILGDKVYEVMKRDPKEPPAKGFMRIVAVDRAKGSIVMEYVDD